MKQEPPRPEIPKTEPEPVRPPQPDTPPEPDSLIQDPPIPPATYRVL